MEPKQYNVKKIDITKGVYEVVLNQEDAEDLGVRTHDRVKIINEKGETLSALVDTTDTLVTTGEIGAFDELWQDLQLQPHTTVRIIPTSHPVSVDFIRKKICGNTWNKEEITFIINDIAQGNLSTIELTAYVTAVQINGLTMDETTWLTTAMVNTGETIEWETSPILDVHSIGGVPGNKYAPITVPIVAANGLTIPKTSSRAISSPAGTADIMEVVCKVKHDALSIKHIGQTVGGTLTWGGGVSLAPVDNIIIKVEHPLSLDPRGQLLASVMSKKKSIGAEYCVIDIPIGEEAKVKTSEEARELARDFIALGDRIGVKTRCAITYGGQPVGRAVGPALEIKEALSILEGASQPNSTIEKALSLAGLLLEMGGTYLGKGRTQAKKTLKSGKALQKFREIIAAQGGNPDITADDITPGGYTYDLLSPKDGYIESISNRAIVTLARAAGSPRDTGAGIMLQFKKGERAERGETLLTIYAENQRKLKEAKALAIKFRPVRVEGMILEDIVE